GIGHESNIYRAPVSAPGGPATYLHAVELRGQHVDHRADPIPLPELGAAALMECDACSTPDRPMCTRSGNRPPPRPRRPAGGCPRRLPHAAPRRPDPTP